jgi:hypothetical protein
MTIEAIFLENATNKDLFDKGLTTRRAVLDAECVNAAIANADDFG